VSRRRPLSGIRLGVVEAMLTVMMLTWSLNIIITRHVMTHGVEPLVYASLRYFSGGMILLVITRLGKGRSAPGGGPVWLLSCACVLIAANQISFVYALRLTNASTVALIFGVAATVSLAGVGAIAVAAGAGGFSTDLKGVLVAIFMLVTWSLYTVIASILMRWWSPGTITSTAFVVSGLILLALAIPQFQSQDWDVAPSTWGIMAFATLTLLLTNILYLDAMDRMGPSHMALFSNFFPFVTVILAVVLLSETLAPLDVVGGVLIAAAMAISWRTRRQASDARAAERALRSAVAGDVAAGGTTLTNERS
jgi:drug/metabolite transporter (DMT)-like permease